MEILQEIYDSEINFSLSTFWDGGFDWKLGDEMNGVDAEGSEATLDSAVAAIVSAVMEHYPESSFAKARNE